MSSSSRVFHSSLLKQHEFFLVTIIVIQFRILIERSFVCVCVSVLHLVQPLMLLVHMLTLLYLLWHNSRGFFNAYVCKRLSFCMKYESVAAFDAFIVHMDVIGPENSTNACIRNVVDFNRYWIAQSFVKSEEKAFFSSCACTILTLVFETKRAIHIERCARYFAVFA